MKKIPQKSNQGISLVEVIIFILLMGILASTILIPATTTFKSIPQIHNINIASKKATQCMEWFLGQRYINGFNSIICPSSTIPPICTVPAGFNITVNTTCGNATGDLNYKIINISVSNGVIGIQNLSLQIANY